LNGSFIGPSRKIGGQAGFTLQRRASWIFWIRTAKAVEPQSRKGRKGLYFVSDQDE